MRLFVAVYPQAVAREELAAVVGGLRIAAAAANQPVGMVAPELWHLTLAFLGEVPDDRAPAAGSALVDAVGRWRASNGGPLTLRLAGGGRFGRGRSTVVWAGVAGDLAGLRALSAATRRRLRRAGLPYDPKPLRPHLTLARPRGRVPAADVAADVAALAEFSGMPWQVATVWLMRSWPGPGQRYEPVAEVSLSAGPPAG